MIECSECMENVWCCWDKDRWICKRCYLKENHTITQWNDLQEEGRRYRENKRRKDAYREYREITY